MWAAITSHAHIWGFHGNMHIAWGFYCIGIIILHLIPCSLQNIDESVPVCLELKLCQSHDLVRLSSTLIQIPGNVLITTFTKYTISQSCRVRFWNKCQNAMEVDDWKTTVLGPNSNFSAGIAVDDAHFLE